jgi:hypothetical protein
MLVQGWNPRKVVTPATYPELTAAIRALGLTATGDEVAQAVTRLYPNGHLLRHTMAHQ